MSIGQNSWCSFSLMDILLQVKSCRDIGKKRARCNTELFTNILVILSDFMMSLYLQRISYVLFGFICQIHV